MIHLLIISDDFTGALDTGVQFSAYGKRIKVMSACVDDRGIKNAMEEYEVLVINTETRHCTSEQAFLAVRKLISYARSYNIPYIYKKTDSVLRGNVGSELAAAYFLSDTGRVDFIPAFPDMKRVTRKGVHYVRGIPIAESAFAKDPFNPVLHSYIPDIIGEQSDIPAVVVERLSDLEKELPETGIFIYDVETREDIWEVAEYLRKNKLLHVMAGCAGFAKILPEILGYKRKKQSFRMKCKRLVVICGSVNNNSLEQVAYAQSMGVEREVIAFQDYSGFSESGRIEKVWKRIEGIIRENRVLMMNVDTGGRIEKRNKKAVEEILGSISNKILKVFPDCVAYIIGGDTLCGFLKAADCRELEPLGEIMPGVVVSNMWFYGTKRLIISKSGGFGEKDLIVQLLEKVLEKGEERIGSV